MFHSNIIADYFMEQSDFHEYIHILIYIASMKRIEKKETFMLTC